jgi:glycosyltransferase involved in cell wall biosynthesis
LAWRLRKTDIVICDSWKSLQALPRAVPQTVVVLAHGQEYLFASDAKRNRVKRLLQRATHLVASSHATLNLVKSVCDTARVCCTVIAPTYGLDMAQMPPSVQYALRHQRLAAGVCLGRLVTFCCRSSRGESVQNGLNCYRSIQRVLAQIGSTPDGEIADASEQDRAIQEETAQGLLTRDGLEPDRSVAIEKAQDKPIQLLSICRLEARKGLKAVVQVLAKRKDWPNFFWHIAGDGPAKSELMQAVQVAGMQSQVRFYGRIDEAQKNALFAQADLFVMPSYPVGRSLEGFGIVYVEAARYGVASIAGVAGGVRDAVLHEKTGWCVDPLSSPDLDAVLSTALRDQACRCRYGIAAFLHYQRSFASSQVMRAFLAHILPKHRSQVSV